MCVPSAVSLLSCDGEGTERASAFGKACARRVISRNHVVTCIYPEDPLILRSPAGAERRFTSFSRKRSFSNGSGTGSMTGQEKVPAKGKHTAYRLELEKNPLL